MRALFVAVVLIAAVSFIALLLTGPRAIWAAWRARHPQAGEWPLGVGQGALIPEQPLPEGPLVLALEDEHWELWQGCAWIAAIKVRITNVSATQGVALARFGLDSDPGPGDRPKLTQDQVNTLFKEVMTRRENYGSAHLRRMDLQLGDSISGWFVWEAYLPYPASAGRPRCVFTVTDGVGDSCELEIPVRERQVRRAGPEE